MSQETFPPSKKTLESARIKPAQYDAMYNGSISQPEVFWAVQSKRLDWYKKPNIIKNTSFEGDVSIKWYEDGKLNACYNCVDRHVENGNGDDIALIWEGDEPHQDEKVTYEELQTEVCLLANGLKDLGIEKGERVIIYMPMVLQAVYAMLACARIGAVHSVVFGGFSPNALSDRINDCEAKLVITADEGVRGGKKIPLKANVDEALQTSSVEKVVVLKHRDAEIAWDEKRDVWYHELIDRQEPDCPCEEMNAEDPLFILYTSGSTGKPKGVLHTTGGYMVYASLTHEVVFDYKQGEVYWCTADVGWVTGHSYIVYGPLANGATSLVFEGVPNYPDWSRFWNIVEKHKVNIFYTAPTAIRALIKEGDKWVTETDRSSLRILGTVGEPINHEAWLWYYNIVGEKRCPVIDTWWQTETGGHMITPLPCHDLKPGKAQKPFFGVQPALVDNEGKILEGEAEGNFVMLDSWPGQMRTVYGDHERFKNTYFIEINDSNTQSNLSSEQAQDATRSETYASGEATHSEGKGRRVYFTGDGASRDADGDYRITGRVDDVINVSGHRLGTAEIESAINEHTQVAESAVVGYPHDVKGQGIYAYVILNEGVNASDDIKSEIVKIVRKIIGPIASPDVIQITNGLPKTRSGKIMRRILRKIAANETDSLGDTSTLADPGVVDALIAGK